MRIVRSVTVVSALAGLALVAGCSGPGGNRSSAGADSAPRKVTGATPATTGTARPGAAPPVDARTTPKSTFALDVDTASYSYARRQLTAGSLPDPSTVRPEEFVNAFRQDYAQPAGSGFSVTTDGAKLPDSGTRIMRVGLQTRSEDAATRRDVALTFAIDTSGSMDYDGKLGLVKDALHTLIRQLRPSDRVAIVAYADEPRVLRELTAVSDRNALDDAIDELSASGSTDLGSGVETAYRVARDGYRKGATNRVILLSDGLANQGDTDSKTILDKVSDQAGRGITLLCVGVGGDYGDALMEQLADHGHGMAVYVGDQAEARRTFTTELTANLTVRARAAKAQVEFDPKRVRSYRLIGFDDRRLAADDFRNDAVDGGWVGPGHSVTALYEVTLRPKASGRVATARVRWQDPKSDEAKEAARTVSVSDLDGALADAAPRLRADRAVAAFAEWLRGDRYASDVRPESLASTADAAADATEDAQLRELATLIRTAAKLKD
jgi:Ca-activated chloride channel family protein